MGGLLRKSPPRISLLHTDAEKVAVSETALRAKVTSFERKINANLASSSFQPAKSGVGAYFSVERACQDCVSYYPKKKMGGSPDLDGIGLVRKWENKCYSGPCDFETPWAGGPQDQSCGDGGWECVYWSEQGHCSGTYASTFMRSACKKSCQMCKPDHLPAKFCFSLDPIGWYSDCADVLHKDAKTVMETAKVCEYDMQMMVVSSPAVWIGKANPFELFKDEGSTSVDCQAVISEDAVKLYDMASFVDSLGLPITECCERVHQFFTCVGEKQEIIQHDMDGLTSLDRVSFKVMGPFASYCVPFFKYPTKPEFCAEYPQSDPCVAYHTCNDCVDHGGVWCQNSNTCGIQGYEECGAYNARTREDCRLCCSGLVAAPPPLAPPTPPPAPAVSEIPRDPNWWWQLINNRTYYAAGYIPNPRIGVKQPPPPMFKP